MESPFACDMNALTPQQRIRHGDLAAQLISAVVDFKELPNGYAASIGGIKVLICIQI